MTLEDRVCIGRRCKFVYMVLAAAAVCRGADRLSYTAVLHQSRIDSRRYLCLCRVYTASHALPLLIFFGFFSFWDRRHKSHSRRVIMEKGGCRWLYEFAGYMYSLD